ncbi:MAG: GNAT family N-acetyltransferase [Pseudomonadota bacterium]
MNFQRANHSDTEAIIRLFTAVFSDSEGEAEGQLIGNLARELLSETEERDRYVFVALDADTVIGAIVFSRLTFDSGNNAFILAPVAVATTRQGEGVGQRLIRFGFERLREDGVELVMTYGDPAFYAKVGFQPVTVATVKPPFPLSQPQGWLGQSLNSESISPITGSAACVDALNKPEYW